MLEKKTVTANGNFLSLSYKIYKTGKPDFNGIAREVIFVKDGFIKVAAVSPELRVADCAFNSVKITEAVFAAAERGVSLLVFPELCVTGYTCADLFLQKSLTDGAEAALSRIAEETAGLDIVAIVGVPLIREGKLYNCAAVVQGGRVLAVVPKTHLPNYGEFQEPRWFEPGRDENAPSCCADAPFGARLAFKCRQMPEFAFAVEICEDLWVAAPPSVRHAEAGALLIANLSASDETIAKAEYRRTLVAGQSARLACGYVYADAGTGESTTDMVFSGHNLIAANGSILAESPPFAGGYCSAEIDLQAMLHERRRLTTFRRRADGYSEIYFDMRLRETALSARPPRLPFVPGEGAERAARLELVLNIQAHGLKKRLAHTGVKKIVLGVSGGLDSTLALLVAARAADLSGRPRTDILAVTMPAFGTTERTRGNAEKLCLRLGAELRTVDISEAVKQHFSDIGHDMSRHDVTYENSQARERTQVLMDVANQAGGLVVGTGDLSELALGFTTYNGDHMSMYGVNAGIPKTLVRHLVRYEAERAADAGLREALLDVLDTPVSPELLPPGAGGPAQRTEEIVGPYELHDFFLYYAVRWGFTPSKILRLAKIAFEGSYEGEEILKWLKIFYRRFFAQQFKRSCLPDGPKVGSVSLSPRGDWRMPSDAAAALWLGELDSLQP